jgi:dTDP-4-amino-4,6-dideoxygalactose transaminase
MPEITAALVRSQASCLGESITQRRRIAAKYDSRLPWETSDKWVRALPVLKGNEHAYHLYPVTLSGYIDRDRVQDLLSAADIGTAVHYPPVHLLSWIRNLPGWATSGGLGLRVTEQLGRAVLSLPMYPELEDKDVEYITEQLVRAVEGG